MDHGGWRKTCEGSVSRKTLLLAMLLVSLGIAAYLGVRVWNSLGEADKAARHTTLAVIRGWVVGHAQRTGRYPEALGTKFVGNDWPLDVNVNHVQYIVGGSAYREDPHQVLFYETVPQRYGFERGYFVVHQLYVEFVRGHPSQQQVAGSESPG